MKGKAAIALQQQAKVWFALQDSNLFHEYL